jgi:BRCT domain type II-containing protein
MIDGLNVSFTGTLQLGEREALLVPLLQALGATWNKDPKRATDLLVFGDRDPNYLRAGMEKSKKLEKAELLRETLGHIEIIDEGSFLKLLPGDIVSRIRAEQ